MRFHNSRIIIASKREALGRRLTPSVTCLHVPCNSKPRNYFLRRNRPLLTPQGSSGSLGNVTGLRHATTVAEFAVKPSTLSCSTPNSPCATAADFVPAALQSGFGNFPRNTLRGPKFFDTDLNVTKNIPVTERM